MKRLFGVAALLGALAPSVSLASDAAAWPVKPVRVIVSAGAGGSGDMLARLISQDLGNEFGQPFAVEPRPGASGIIASQMVQNAEPDGHTLLISSMSSHVVAPLQNPVYDPIEDFSHIAFLGGTPTVLVVNSGTPVKNVAEFIAYAKGLPNGLSWGSPGLGTHGSLIGSTFQALTGLKMMQVGYKAAAPAVTDLIGNQIQAGFMTLNSATGGLRAGKLRALALTSAKRLPDYPDTPTFEEAGFPQLTSNAWFALAGPRGVPKPVIDRLNAAVRKALHTPNALQVLQKQGMTTEDWDVAAHEAFVKSEVDRWRPHVKATATPAS